MVSYSKTGSCSMKKPKYKSCEKKMGEKKMGVKITPSKVIKMKIGSR